jgi:hypothetical protein
MSQNTKTAKAKTGKKRLKGGKKIGSTKLMFNPQPDPP